MKVYITSAYPIGLENPDNFAAVWLRESAEQAPFHTHEICADPDAADLILFMETHPGEDPFFEKVLSHPLRQQFRAKTFLYHDADYASVLMQGVYPSVKKQHYDGAFCRAGIYMARIAENKEVYYWHDSQRYDFLFSFVGANNCAVRSNLLNIKYKPAYLQDTTGLHAWTLSSADREAYERAYADICRRSEFILCPRGIGPSSYRLYEAMEMGKCPVILSDDWVPPPFINWSEFSITISEKDYVHIPKILEHYSGSNRGELAREAWEKFVEKPVCFHWITEACAAIMREQAISHKNVSQNHYLRLAQLGDLPLYLKSKIRKVRQRLAGRSSR